MAAKHMVIKPTRQQKTLLVLLFYRLRLERNNAATKREYRNCCRLEELLIYLYCQASKLLPLHHIKYLPGGYFRGALCVEQGNGDHADYLIRVSDYAGARAATSGRGQYPAEYPGDAPASFGGSGYGAPLWNASADYARAPSGYRLPLR